MTDEPAKISPGGPLPKTWKPPYDRTVREGQKMPPADPQELPYSPKSPVPSPTHQKDAQPKEPNKT